MRRRVPIASLVLILRANRRDVLATILRGEITFCTHCEAHIKFLEQCILSTPFKKKIFLMQFSTWKSPKIQAQKMSLCIQMKLKLITFSFLGYPNTLV